MYKTTAVNTFLQLKPVASYFIEYENNFPSILRG